MDETLSRQLCNNAIFDGLTPEQISGILPCIVYSVHDYDKEECLLGRGQPVEHLGIVLTGCVQLCREGEALADIGENGILGEADLFSSAGKTPYRVVADGDTTVAFLSRDFFYRACSKDCPSKEAHQRIMRNMLRLLSDKTLQLSRKISYLTAPDLRTKIAMYLWDLYEATGSRRFTMPLNRDQLAEYFSVARPSLSRELVGLKGMGIIDFQRSKVEILDPEALYGLARGG